MHTTPDEGPNRETAGSRDTRLVALVGAITLLGLGLRLPSFNDSFYGDELSTYFVVNGFGVDDLLGLVRSQQEATPPLYFLLAWLTKGIGDPAEGIRIPSLIGGVAAIPLTYLLGAWTVGRRAGLVGATLIALSPFLIFYSTESRGYELALLFDLLSTIALVRALDTGRVPWWAAYAVCSSAALYSHYTAFFVLAAQFAWAFLVRPQARKPLLVANLGAAVLYLPWVPGYLEDRDQPAAHIIDVLQPFGWSAIKTDVIHWVWHPTLASDVIPGDAALWMIGAATAAGLVALGLRLRSERDLFSWRLSSKTTLIFILAAATPVGAAIYSWHGPSVYLPRNLIASWPALALAIGAFVTAGRGWLRLVAVGLMVGAFAIGGFKMLDADNQRPDYEAVVRFIEEAGSPGDPVVETQTPSPGPQTTLEAELAPEGKLRPDEHPVRVLGNASLRERLESRYPGGGGPVALLPATPPEEIAREAVALARNGTIFLVTPGAGSIEQVRANLYSPASSFLAALPPRFELVETRHYPGFDPFPLTVYELRETGAEAGAQ